MKRFRFAYLTLIISVFLSSCKKEEEVPVVVETEPKPLAGFQFAQQNTNDPFTYKFTNKSTNFKETRWRFADDSTSSEVSPIHTFLNTGTYNVKLIVLNGDGYWAQREETIKISAANLINVKTQSLGGGKLNLTYETPMSIAKTAWLDGYGSSAPTLSEEKSIDLQFDPGTFKQIKLKITTPKGSIAALDLLVSELGIVRDLTTFDNSFTISHENGGGPDGNEGSKKLIDNNTRTKVFLGGVGNNNLSWKFEYFVPQLINGYSFTSGNDAIERDPKKWKLEGSNDGTNWTLVDQRQNEEFPTRFLSRTFVFNNTTPYKIYKFTIQEIRSSSNFQMSECRLLSIPR